MFDIFHRFVIVAPPVRIFEAIALPTGLDAWWTLRSSGEPRVGAAYQFFFDDEHDWRGQVVRCEPARRIEWGFTSADADWIGTQLAFEIHAAGEHTAVDLRHCGWRERNAHYAVTSFCWTTHLRLLKRYVERGETLPYSQREADS